MLKYSISPDQNMLSKDCKACEKGCDFIAANMFCKCPKQILLDVYILHMFTGTGPGRSALRDFRLQDVTCQQNGK